MTSSKWHAIHYLKSKLGKTSLVITFIRKLDIILIWSCSVISPFPGENFPLCRIIENVFGIVRSVAEEAKLDWVGWMRKRACLFYAKAGLCLTGGVGCRSSKIWFQIWSKLSKKAPIKYWMWIPPLDLGCYALPSVPRTVYAFGEWTEWEKIHKCPSACLVVWYQVVLYVSPSNVIQILTEFNKIYPVCKSMFSYVNSQQTYSSGAWWHNETKHFIRFLVESAVICQVSSSVTQRARDVIGACGAWIEHVRNYWLSVKLRQSEQFLIDFVEFNWSQNGWIHAISRRN